MDQSVLSKVRHYCAYQERSHREVRTKLLELGSRGFELEEIMAHLIENNFLNEERYARQFAKGKFNLKKWGKLKIINELKSKGVSDYCIKKGLQEIDPENYFDTLCKLAVSKSDQITGLHPLVRRRKIYTYLAGKGYESNMINEALEYISA